MSYITTLARHRSTLRLRIRQYSASAHSHGAPGVLYNAVDRGHIPHIHASIDRHRTVIICIRQSVRNGRRASVFHGARSRRAREGRTDYGEFFCHAPCIRRSSCCLLLPVQASAPLSFWSKRRDLSICECLY